MANGQHAHAAHKNHRRSLYHKQTKCKCDPEQSVKTENNKMNKSSNDRIIKVSCRIVKLDGAIEQINRTICGQGRNRVTPNKEQTRETLIKQQTTGSQRGWRFTAETDGRTTEVEQSIILPNSRSNQNKNQIKPKSGDRQLGIYSILHASVLSLL